MDVRQRARGRRWWLGVVALGLAGVLAGCQLAGPARPSATPRPQARGARPDVRTDVRAASVIGLNGATLINLDGGTLATLAGGVLVPLKPGVRVADDASTLINLDGGTLINLDGGTIAARPDGKLINLDGGTLINLDGGTLVNLDGGTLTGQALGVVAGVVRVPAGLVGGGKAGAYRLSDTQPVPAANVNVYFRDAQGRFVVGPDGKPISTRTNAQGRFVLQGYLAQGGLTCFVPLDRQGEVLRGFAAVRPKDQRAAQPLAIDPLATLLAGWIDVEVLGRQAETARTPSLDRLTTAAAGDARRHLERVFGAGWAGAAMNWSALACSDEASRRQESDVPMRDAFETVRFVMTLTGANGDQCLAGAGALETPIQLPVSVAAAPDGTVYVAEEWTGYVRRIAPSGTVTNVLGGCSPTGKEQGAHRLTDLVVGVDGFLYGISESEQRVYRVEPNGARVEVIAGGADGARASADAVATTVTLNTPNALALGRDGALLIAQNPDSKTDTPPAAWRLVGGRLQPVPLPTAEEAGSSYHPLALAEAPDGCLWLLTGGDLKALWCRLPGASRWQRLAKDGEGTERLEVDAASALLAMPDGGVLVSLFNNRERTGHRIDHFARDGTRTRFAGLGPAGVDEDERGVARLQASFAGPSGMALTSRGTVLVADNSNGLVREIDPKSGLVTRFAGSLVAPSRVAQDAVLNMPGGITLDPEGRPVLTEYGSSAVRRLDGDRLTLIAGGRGGSVPDGQPAVRLAGVTSVAAARGGFYLAEAQPRKLRFLRPDGTLETLAGGGTVSLSEPPTEAQRRDPRSLSFGELASVMVDREGRVVFATKLGVRDRYHLWRLEPGGVLTWLAGGFGAEVAKGAERWGKPGRACALGRLAGLASDGDGNIFMAEALETQVLRLAPDGTLTRLAGLDRLETFLRIQSGQASEERDVAASEATLLIPAALACDAAGDLYVAEIGTRVATAHIGEGIPGAADLRVLDGRIRKITRAGRAITLAGLGSGRADGVRNPVGLAVGPDGRVYFVDNATNQLKVLAPQN